MTPFDGDSWHDAPVSLPASAGTPPNRPPTAVGVGPSPPGAEPPPWVYLGWSDAWLLAATLRSQGRMLDLPELVVELGRLGRDLPTYDAVAFALRRLMAAGLLMTAEGRIAATPDAWALLSGSWADGADQVGRVSAAIEGPHERRAGGIGQDGTFLVTEREWRRAVSDYRRSVRIARTRLAVSRWARSSRRWHALRGLLG